MKTLGNRIEIDIEILTSLIDLLEKGGKHHQPGGDVMNIIKCISFELSLEGFGGLQTSE